MAGKIIVKDREIVIPGDVVAEGDINLPWSPYLVKFEGKYIVTTIALAEVQENHITLIPLEGSKYIPRIGDEVIGLVTDVSQLGWELDINSPYLGYLPASSLLGRPVNPGEELRRYLDIGDYVLGKIEAFDRTTDPLLTVKGKNLGRIPSGIVLDISPNKVPRVIGRNKSMLNTLVSETGCDIIVSENGRIWAKCPSKQLEDLLILALKKIETEAHIKGLTDKITQLLKQRVGEINAKT
ncbi:RNA-binding protein [Sulfolobales archaeon HS-7]|nr:RNA-binding protein [Sulfolobales archaeon HS-7]